MPDFIGHLMLIVAPRPLRLTHISKVSILCATCYGLNIAVWHHTKCQWYVAPRQLNAMKHGLGIRFKGRMIAELPGREPGEVGGMHRLCHVAHIVQAETQAIARDTHITSLVCLT